MRGVPHGWGMNLSWNPVRVGAVLAGLAVVLGAFGAHALSAVLEDRATTAVWETAVHYQFVHALALLLLGSLENGRRAGVNDRMVGPVAGCWIAGVLFFSGSLYLLALGGPRWLGPVTPLGGIAFIIGWALLAGAARGGRPEDRNAPREKG